MKSALAILAGLAVVAIVAMAMVVILAGGTQVVVTTDVVDTDQSAQSIRLKTDSGTLICPLAGCCAGAGGTDAIDTATGAVMCSDGTEDEACRCHESE